MAFCELEAKKSWEFGVRSKNSNAPFSQTRQSIRISVLFLRSLWDMKQNVKHDWVYCTMLGVSFFPSHSYYVRYSAKREC